MRKIQRQRFTPNTAINNIVLRELERIKQGSKLKMLDPTDVVAAASDPVSPLHDFFCWDDTEAAIQWRLHQARNLIRVVVTIHPVKLTPIHGFVSMTKDQGNGGYRSLPDVLSNKELRAEFLRQALRELELHQQRYGELEELADVYEALEKVRTVVSPKKGPRQRVQASTKKALAGVGALVGTAP